MSGKGRGVTGGFTAICVIASVVLGIALAWGANRSPAAADAAVIYSEGGTVAPMAGSGVTSEDKRPPDLM